MLHVVRTLLLASLFLLGCGHAPELRVITPAQESGWQVLDVDAVLAAHPMEEGSSYQVINLEGTEGASHHLVRVRTEEGLHYHRRHDATAVLLRGHGTLYLKGRAIDLHKGHTVTISRRVVHRYTNASEAPSVFYVIFAPPMKEVDRVTVRNVDEMQQ